MKSAAPLDLAFQTWTITHDQQQLITSENLFKSLVQTRRLDWVVDITLFITTFAAISALHFWAQISTREKALHQAITDNLNLNVELEQHKLNALRAQLEPHFLFNALNAISALVRMDDKKAAVAGLNRLSDLLRYALHASSREWVCLEDELRFVSDYLSLQKLRYGERLVVRITGDNADVRTTECPPLILQPLLENALRHDLDCRQDVSDILIDFQIDPDNLHIIVSNPVAPAAAPNPGLGLGLRNTAARLELLYADRAGLQTAKAAGRFTVQITLPLRE